MAASRPPIDSYFTAPKTTSSAERPSVDSFFIGDGKTSVMPRQTEKVPFFPVKEDLPGLASSVVNGATQGLSDIGREPISKIMSGYPGEFAERGAQAYKTPKRTLMQGALEGPGGAVRSLMQSPLPTPESQFHFPVLPQPKSIMGKLTGMGLEIAAGAKTGEAVDGAVTALAPKARSFATRTVRGMIKPSGEYAESGDEISKALLDEGLVKGSKEDILEGIKTRSEELNNEINGILDKYSNRQVSPEKAIQYMNEVREKYKGNAALDSTLNKVDEVINKISNQHNLKRPTYDTFEEEQGNSFVMGPASKQVSPQITRVKGSDVSNKVAPADFNEIWGEYKPEVITPSKFVENPEDIVALHNPGEGANVRRLTTISPKETYGLRPDVEGPSNKRMVTREVGEAPNPMGVKQAQARKKGQYEVSYDSDAETPERNTRKAYARALKEGIEQAIPEENISGLNERLGNLSEASQVLGKRLGVSNKSDLINLGDKVLIGTAPKAAIARKFLGWDPMQSFIASKLYNFPKNARNFKNYSAAQAIERAPRRLLES